MNEMLVSGQRDEQPALCLEAGGRSSNLTLGHFSMSARPWLEGTGDAQQHISRGLMRWLIDLDSLQTLVTVGLIVSAIETVPLFLFIFRSSVLLDVFQMLLLAVSLSLCQINSV